MPSRNRTARKNSGSQRKQSRFNPGMFGTEKAGTIALDKASHRIQIHQPLHVVGYH
jgi:hypothetical protein